VNVHGIRKLESLEVGVGDDVGRRSEVFNFVKFGHDLRTDDAAELVDELDPLTSLDQGPLPDWICIQHWRLSPRKLAVTAFSIFTWNGRKVTDFS
jgi:hypothetical protein